MVMYDIYGRLVPNEKPLPHLSGYQNSLPVLRGNMAASQVQMDTYGEVICALARLYKGKGRLDRETAFTLIRFGKYVCDHWSEPDAGIWEPRGEPELHTHSLLLCWVALDELIRLAESGEIDRLPLDRFRSTREEIRAFIETKAWKSHINSYSSVFTSAKMDATLLLMAFHNFHEGPSPKR